MQTSLFQTETRRGKAVIVGETRIVPLAKSVRLLIPGGWGGLIWNRPAGVEVTTGTHTTMLPIRDVTRWVQVLLLGAGVLAVVLAWSSRNRD